MLVRMEEKAFGTRAEIKSNSCCAQSAGANCKFYTKPIR